MTDALTLPETMHTIPGGLAFWAEHTPHAPAILVPDGRLLTHAGLREAMAGVVSNLVALGITSEDRVALVLPGGADTAIALLGIVHSAVAVPFNPAISAPELQRDLEHLHPRLLVAESGGETPATEVAATLGIATVTLADIVSVSSPPAYHLPLAPTRPDDIAAILHTSGTTGKQSGFRGHSGPSLPGRERRGSARRSRGRMSPYWPPACTPTRGWSISAPRS